MQETIAFYVSALRKNLNTYTDSRLKKFGLTDGIFYYLLYIGKHPGCTMSQAAKELRADNGHVTRCINKLTGLGYVDKTQSGKDRRHHHLSLTAEGQVIFQELHTLVYDWDEEISASLPPEQKQALIELLRKITPGKGEEAHV